MDKSTPDQIFITDTSEPNLVYVKDAGETTKKEVSAETKIKTTVRRHRLFNPDEDIFIKLHFELAWLSTNYIAQKPFIERCKFTSDDRELIFCGSDGFLRFLDLEDKSKLKEEKVNDGIIWSFDLSDDNRFICICTEDNSVMVFSRESMQCLASHYQHEEHVWKVCFSRDNRYILSCSSDGSIIIWLFNAEEDTFIVLKGHSNVVEDIAVSPNGKELVSCSQDHTLRIWKDLCELGKGKGIVCDAVLRGHKQRVICCTFAPHRDNIIASGSADCTIILWDILLNSILFRLKGHFNIIWSCSFLRTRNASFVISCSSDHSFR